LRKAFALPTVAIVAAAFPLLTMSAASAAEGSAQADLTPTPSSPGGGTGQAMVEISGTTLSFTLAAQGLLADAPHAAHIHFGQDARHECPTDEDNTDPTEFFTTTEGAPAYGEIVVSLTTEGDTSPDSALAVDRFGVGDDFEYSRGDVQVSEDVAQAILDGESAVVIHGVDYDGDGAYSEGERGASELDESLPGEATDPALCGVLAASQMGEMPEGGVETGAGSTTGVENAGLIGLGALATVGGGALLIRRRFTTDN
jgi:hypothetical protein